MNESNNNTLTVAIIARDEESHIRETFLAVERAISESKWNNYQVILIDDCSRDNTYSIAMKVAESFDNVEVLRNKYNIGLGGSYRRALKRARGEFFIEVHGKNDIDEKSLQKILNSRNAAQVVIPYTANFSERGFFRRILSRLFVKIVNVVTNNNLRYYNHYILTKTDLLKEAKSVTKSYAFQAEILLQLLKKNYSYVEVGVIDIFHPKRVTKAFSLKNIVGVCLFLLKISKYRRRSI